MITHGKNAILNTQVNVLSSMDITANLLYRTNFVLLINVILQRIESRISKPKGKEVCVQCLYIVVFTIL